jgi:hypothetical protein
MALLLGGLLLGGWLPSTVWNPPAQAQISGYGFAPQTYKSGYTYGSGVYFAPHVFTIYSKPDEASPAIAEFHWGRKTSSTVDVTTPDGEHRVLDTNHMFVCFYPKLDVAMMAVLSEGENGWVEVIYDQSGPRTGWVKLKDEPRATTAKGESLAPLDTGEPAYFGVYQTWQEFMKLNARADGVYWLTGVTEYNRGIRSSDADDAKIYPITIIRDLKVKFIRGNWMIVEVLDFERNTPIGWVRWRDDDGNLMVFPNITKRHQQPIVTSMH